MVGPWKSPYRSMEKPTAGEDDVIGSGIQISKPPRLVCRVLDQQREYYPVMLFLPSPLYGSTTVA
jgi:hypothetical protein